MASELPATAEPLTAAHMRRQLVDRIWLGWLLVAILGWPTSLIRIFSTGWQPMFAIHTGVAMLMIAVYLQRDRLPTRFKIAVAAALPFLIGIPALLTFGFYSAGMLWLVMGCLVAAFFFSRRWMVVLLLAELLFLLLVAWGFVGGYLTSAVDGNAYIHSVDAWLGILIGIMTASVVVALAVQQYNRSLTELLATVTTQRDLIYHQAMHDALTGLPALRLARDRLGQACARATRSKSRTALLFIDLDGFKGANDRYGHDAGDAALKVVAQRLQGAVREIDTAARLGGDEFLVIYVDVSDPAQAGALAERLLALLTQPIPHGDQLLEVGASIGIALYPDHAGNPEQLITRADQAMYQVKKSSGSGWQLYQPA